jgi:hypothetical protein
LKRELQVLFKKINNSLELDEDEQVQWMKKFEENNERDKELKNEVREAEKRY